MSDRPRNHGHASFAPEDVEDAKRGAPAVSLDGYAAARGLEMKQRGSLAGFRMALPNHPEETFNLMRGVLPGGRFGVMFHQLLQTHFGPEDSRDMSGSFHRVRTSNPPGSLRRALVPDRTWIPYIGSWLNAPTEQAPDQAFMVPGAWSPTTALATPVPETNALLARLVFVRRSRTQIMHSGGSVNIGDGWRVYPGGRVDEDAFQRVITGPFVALLDRIALTYAEVRLDHGMLLLRRHGFVTDEAQLDDLAHLLAAMADALVAAADTGLRHDFSQPLFACPWETDDTLVTEPYVAGAWSADFRAYAARHGLTMEDPEAWHQGLGHLPVPGRVVAVLRHPHGGRALFTTDVPINKTRAVRGAVAVQTDAPDTFAGGIRDEATTTAVKDGVAVVFTHRLFGFAHEADDLIDVAMQAARRAGVL